MDKARNNNFTCYKLWTVPALHVPKILSRRQSEFTQRPLPMTCDIGGQREGMERGCNKNTEVERRRARLRLYQELGSFSNWRLCRDLWQWLISRTITTSSTVHCVWYVCCIKDAENMRRRIGNAASYSEGLRSKFRPRDQLCINMGREKPLFEVGAKYKYIRMCKETFNLKRSK